MSKLSASEMLAALKSPQKRSRKKEVAEDSKWTAEEKAKMDAEGTGLSGAAKQWETKFLGLTDSEYWLAFCFFNDEDIATFVEQAGLEGLGIGHQTRMLSEPFLEALDIDLEEKVEKAHQKMTRFRVDKDEIKRNLTYEPLPDPFEGVEFPDDLEEATKVEVGIIEDLLRKGTPEKWLKRHGRVDDYPNWFLVAFPSREEKDHFLRVAQLDHIGNKYMDGYKVAKALGLKLTAPKR